MADLSYTSCPKCNIMVQAGETHICTPLVLAPFAYEPCPIDSPTVTIPAPEERDGIDTRGLELKSTNPKDVIGIKKCPLHLIPSTAKAILAMAFKNGAIKYGPYNWRDEGVSASVYIAAVQRHLDEWYDGEELAGDSGVHHLGHAMACLAIILDAQECGKLVDDRPTPAPTTELHDKLKEE